MTDAMTTRPVEFSDDGKELYWLDSRGRDKAAVVAQDMATGGMRILAEDAEAVSSTSCGNRSACDRSPHTPPICAGDGGYSIRLCR